MNTTTVADANKFILAVAPFLTIVSQFCTGINKDKPKACGALTMANLELIKLSGLLGFHLTQVVQEKLKINDRKYPVEWCLRYKGKQMPKYTKNKETKISSDSDTPILDKLIPFELGKENSMSAIATFRTNQALLNEMVKQFATKRERLGDYTHTSVALSLWSEYGELCTVLQWKKGTDKMKPEEANALMLETADVAIYILHALRLLDED